LTPVDIPILNRSVVFSNLDRLSLLRI